MLGIPDATQRKAAEQFVRTLIALTRGKEFKKLTNYYQSGKLDKNELAALLERNQQGHLRMLNEILANRKQWLLMGEKIMALGADGGVEYPGEDGMFIEFTKEGLAAEPFADSPVLNRVEQALDSEIRDGAAMAGVSPFVYREVRRLGGQFSTPKAADAITAFKSIQWGDEAIFSTAKDGNDGFIYEASFGEYDYLPEGFQRNKEMKIIGNDCYHYFGLVKNDRDAGDPIVVSLDHEEEGEDPHQDKYLSDWLSKLHRGRYE